jgi:hypothetical protein
MQMLSPDLLDRRALALIRLVDVYGRPVEGPVRIVSDGVKTVAKGPGEHAILAAPGFEEHVRTFDAPPASPAVRSKHILLDLTPVAKHVLPRSFDLRLPRDPDPAHKLQPTSLFQAAEIEMSPSPRASLSGSACALRVTVRRKDDKRLIENALVRAQSDNGLFSARAMTDARGEACLLFPVLPLAFAGGGATVLPDLPGKAIADADPASAFFHAPAELPAAAEAAAMRTSGHADPDAIAASIAPDFAPGSAVRLAAGRQISILIEWEA